MIATYLNKYNDSVYTYYDLRFSENGENLLSVVGVGFLQTPTYEEMLTFAHTFAENNLPSYTLENIIID